MPEPYQTPESRLLSTDDPIYALTPENWALVEPAPTSISGGPWAVWRDEGAVYKIETIAHHFDVTVQEVKDRLSEDGAGATGGDGGDVGVTPVPADELDADLDQGTFRTTVRNLDRGAVAAIQEVTGASSGADAVRKAVQLAKDVLVKE